jgi:hypothetical protein
MHLRNLKHYTRDNAEVKEPCGSLYRRGQRDWVGFIRSIQVPGKPARMWSPSAQRQHVEMTGPGGDYRLVRLRPALTWGEPAETSRSSWLMTCWRSKKEERSIGCATPFRAFLDRRTTLHDCCCAPSDAENRAHVSQARPTFVLIMRSGNGEVGGWFWDRESLLESPRHQNSMKTANYDVPKGGNIAKAERLRLFTDFSHKPLLEAPPSIVVLPLWQLLCEDQRRFKDKSEFRDTDRFRDLLLNAEEYFDYVRRPAEANFAVLPSDWKHYKCNDLVQRAIQFIVAMRGAGLKTVVQYHSDDEEPIPEVSGSASSLAEHTIVCRTSLFRSNRRHNEYVMPGFVGDPLSVYGGGKLAVRTKNAIPRIGFCGKAITGSASSAVLNSNLQSLDVHFSTTEPQTRSAQVYALRYALLSRLSQDKRLDTSFIVRGDYCGGIDCEHDTLGLSRVREEYYQNLIGSDYTLCIRGEGNYSFRFFETLAMGRIPILIDTDSPLPFTLEIDWGAHALIVKPEDLNDIADVVLRFHGHLSNQAFQNMQKANRALFLSLLTPQAFFFRCLSDAKGEASFESL